MRNKTFCVLAILAAPYLFPATIIAQSQAAKPLDYIIVPPEGGYQLGAGKWKLTTNQTRGSIAICEINIKDTTDWNSVPSHVHTREDELWYVVEGELMFKINDQIKTAGPGSLVFGPRNTMHAYRISKAPVKYLLMLTPAGIDRLFLEVDSISKKFPRGSEEWKKRIGPLGEKFGAYQPAKWDSIQRATNEQNDSIPDRSQDTRVNAQDKDIENKIRELEKNESEGVLKHDSAALMKIWADDFIVNTPYNFVGQREKGDPMRLYYARFNRNIERLIVYNDSLVMTMGNEIVLRKPPMTYAGLTLTRRYTHVWMKRNGKWQLAIRHANFICSEVKQQ